MSMRFILVATILFSFSFHLLADDWTGITDCGSYLIRGITRSTKNGLIIVVNEKTQSEITILVPILNEAMLAPYIDRAITATVTVEKKLPGEKVRGTIQHIKSRNPNPLNPKDTGVSIITKADCK
jgi:hypothetical protein